MQIVVHRDPAAIRYPSGVGVARLRTRRHRCCSRLHSVLGRGWMYVLVFFLPHNPYQAVDSSDSWSNMTSDIVLQYA